MNELAVDLIGPDVEDEVNPDLLFLIPAPLATGFLLEATDGSLQLIVSVELVATTDEGMVKTIPLTRAYNAWWDPRDRSE